MSRPVLIIGAGVGGLALGRSLSRLGVAAKVFDCRKPSEARLNRGLGLWDESQNCLRDLGLKDFLETKAHFIPPAAYRSTDGAWLSSASAAQHNKRRVACVEQNALLAALGYQLDVTYGKRLIQIKEHKDGVTAQFEDGSTVEGCALVGADGVASAVRKLLFPEVALQHAGEVCFSGFSDSDTISAIAGPKPFETIGAGPHGPMRIAVIPIGARRHFWFATISLPPGHTTGNTTGTDSDLAGWESAFAHWHEPIPAILDAARRPAGPAAAAAVLLREDMYALARPLDRWSRGRCVLLGDACHVIGPNLAQGAAVAIEDASDLGPRLAAAARAGAGAGSAAAAEAKLLEAAGGYEAARRPRAEACRRVTGFTRWLCARPEAARLMRFVPPAVNGRVFDAFLDHSLAAGPRG